MSITLNSFLSGVPVSFFDGGAVSNPITLPLGTRDDPALQFGNSDIGIYAQSGQSMILHGESGANWTFEAGGSKISHIRQTFDGGVANTEWHTNGMHLSTSGLQTVGFSWGFAAFKRDSVLWSRAAGILSLASPDTPQPVQGLEIYETYTDGSNYARLVALTAAGTYTFGAQAAGTGTLRDISMVGKQFYFPDGAEATPPVSFLNFPTTGMRPANAALHFQINGVDRLSAVISGGQTQLTLGRNNGPAWHRNTGIGMQPAEYLGWTPSANQAISNTDTRIYRGSAAGIVEFYNGATSHGLHVYNTRTDASNYERLVLDWKGIANTMRIYPEAAGSGVLRPMHLGNVGQVELIATAVTDTAPADDTTPKKLTLQKLAAPPTNAAYWAASNNPGTDIFYLVLEEGA